MLKFCLVLALKMSKLATIFLAIFLLNFFVNGKNSTEDNKIGNKLNSTIQNGKNGNSINATVDSANSFKVSGPKLSKSVTEKYDNWKVNLIPAG